MKSNFFSAIILVIGIIGCSVNAPDLNQEESLRIVFEASPFFDGDLDTRTSVIPNESYSSYAFIWSEKDTVGIYPDAGSQVYFTMENGAGASTASFDGGAWTCKEGHEYQSYFPFIGKFYLDKTMIPVSFINQKQVGNDNSDHFQKYDYMYTAAVTKESGFLNFSYCHLITAVLPWVELPAGHYTGLTLSLDEALFVTEGTYDLTADNPAIIGKSFSDSMSIELDVTFSSPDILKVYVPLAPMDMSGKTLTITITDENNKEYQYTYNPSKPYQASKIYRLRSATSFVEPTITFADEAVKAICVAKWDTNGDGELSYTEAAAVKHIYCDAFCNNQEITSFDEFQYFTGVTSLYEAFDFCYNLESIIIPESVTDIGGYALYGVKNVTFQGSTAPTFHEYSDEDATYYDCFSDIVILHVKPEAYSSFTRVIIGPEFYPMDHVTVDIPDNEIWYTTTDGSIVETYSHTYLSTFGATLVSNDYSNGLGVMRFDDKVTQIGQNAFYVNQTLSSIFLPSTVTRVESGAFAYCENLTSIFLPSSVERIIGQTFAGSGLTSIVIPRTASFSDISSPLNPINSSIIPFNLCSNLNYAYHKGNWTQQIIQYNTLIELLPGATNVSITNSSITAIGAWALGNCSKVTSVYIGNNCIAIGDSAFRNCTSLSSITFGSSQPPSLYGNRSDTFMNDPLNNSNLCTIRVPSSAVNTYKTAWPEVASRIVGY